MCELAVSGNNIDHGIISYCLCGRLQLPAEWCKMSEPLAGVSKPGNFLKQRLWVRFFIVNLVMLIVLCIIMESNIAVRNRHYWKMKVKAKSCSRFPRLLNFYAFLAFLPSVWKFNWCETEVTSATAEFDIVPNIPSLTSWCACWHRLNFTEDLNIGVQISCRSSLCSFLDQPKEEP